MNKNMCLKGKKLLVLGSTFNIVDIVKTAQKMGLYVIVTDNKSIESAPAKLIADEFRDISIADIDTIVELISKEKIQGVLTGFSDSYLKYYLEICKKADLPCYGNLKSFGVATDKMLFKKACILSDVGIIPGVNAYQFEDILDFVSKQGFPLILKPADNSGSRGVIKCACEKDLKEAYEYARSFSNTNNVICEKFMDCDGIGISYQLVDGCAYLSSVCDRSNYCSEENGSSITGDLLYPSEYLNRYIIEMDESVKRMLKNFGFEHGMVSLQSFVDKDGFYMCEMCYRPSGGQHYIIINDSNKINSLELLIEYAVTGHIIDYDKEQETPYFSCLYAMTHIIGKPTYRIAKFDGVDNVGKLDGVINIAQTLGVGDEVGKDGTTAQVLAKVWYKANDYKALNSLYEKINSMLCIEDSSGESLIKVRSFAIQKSDLIYKK